MVRGSVRALERHLALSRVLSDIEDLPSADPRFAADTRRAIGSAAAEYDVALQTEMTDLVTAS